MRYVLIFVVSYLLGSLNFSIIISRIFTKKDIRTQGSGNAGSTNALRVIGKKLTVYVMIGDMAKGLLSVYFGMLLAGETGAITAGAGVVLGHVYPLFFSFRGGKGILTGLAVFLLLDWRVALCALSVFIVLVFITRFVSLGSMTSSASLVPFSVLFGHTSTVFLAMCICYCVFVFYLHRANIKRLINGEESKIGEKVR